MRKEELETDWLRRLPAREDLADRWGPVDRLVPEVQFLSDQWRLPDPLAQQALVFPARLLHQVRQQHLLLQVVASQRCMGSVEKQARNSCWDWPCLRS
jgi:hypothetical protein